MANEGVSDGTPKKGFSKKEEEKRRRGRRKKNKETRSSTGVVEEDDTADTAALFRPLSAIELAIRCHDAKSYKDFKEASLSG